MAIFVVSVLDAEKTIAKEGNFVEKSVRQSNTGFRIYVHHDYPNTVFAECAVKPATLGYLAWKEVTVRGQ